MHAIYFMSYIQFEILKFVFKLLQNQNKLSKNLLYFGHTIVKLVNNKYFCRNLYILVYCGFQTFSFNLISNFCFHRFQNLK